jgi:hypothetical protein
VSFKGRNKIAPAEPALSLSNGDGTPCSPPRQWPGRLRVKGESRKDDTSRLTPCPSSRPSSHRGQLYGLRKRSVLYSRSAQARKNRELKSLRENSTSLRGQLYGLRKSSVLYQGTTLVGPHTLYKNVGFSPCESHRVPLSFGPAAVKAAPFRKNCSLTLLEVKHYNFGIRSESQRRSPGSRSA